MRISGKILPLCLARYIQGFAKVSSVHADRFRVSYANHTLDKAISRHREGQLEEAGELYRRILKREPRHVDALHLLGVVERQRGHILEAESLITRALHEAPENPLFLNSLGDVYISQGRLDEACLVLTRAIRVKPDYVNAYNNLGCAYREAGMPDESIDHYRHALALHPQQVESLVGLGQVYYGQGDMQAAIPYFERAISVAPFSADAHHSFGLALYNVGRIDEALVKFREALTIAPGDPIYTQGLILALKGIAFTVADGWYERFLVGCLRNSDLNHADIAASAGTMLALKPAVATAIGADPLTDRHIAALTAEPLFLPLLHATVVPLLWFEELVVKLRVTLTEWQNPEYLPLLTAIAHQAFNTGYVYPRSARDIEIEQALLSQPAELMTQVELMSLAAYRALVDVPGARSLVRRKFSPSYVGAMIHRTLREPLEERTIQTHILSLSPVDDDVSKKVQGQYEAFPYPRWINVQRSVPQRLAQTVMRDCPGIADPGWPGTPRLLVAGCGTGRTSITYAQKFPQTEVLGLDLSRTSLAYGIRKARELNLPNVEFCQADILSLDGLEERFEFIDCVGVLHHLDDPIAGWQVLHRLLKQNGIMKIGLYSELARQDVVAAREEIAHAGLSGTDDCIREFRERVKTDPALAHLRSLATVADFYSLGDCRDLLFHVQEHRFSIPAIKRHIDELGLRFLGFSLSLGRAGVRFRTSFPTPAAALDLDCWAAFEEQYPQTFRGMYVFYCAKRT